MPLKRRMVRRRPNRPLLKKNLKRAIKSIEIASAEHKYLMTQLNTSPAVYYDVPRMDCLSLIAQGAGNQQRVGKNVRLANLQLRYLAFRATQTTNGWLRVIVFKSVSDLFGTAPVQSEILYTNTGIGTVMSPHNPNFVHSGTYKVLYDKTLAFDVGVNHQNYNVAVNIPLHNSSCEFANTGSAAADLGSGSIWIYVTSNYATANSDAPLIDYYARLNYTDV